LAEKEVTFAEWARSPGGRAHFREKSAKRFTQPGALEALSRKVSESMRRAHQQNPSWRKRTPEEIASDKAKAKAEPAE
jgi:hypothetical protein